MSYICKSKIYLPRRQDFMCRSHLISVGFHLCGDKASLVYSLFFNGNVKANDTLLLIQLPIDCHTKFSLGHIEWTLYFDNP